MDTAIISSFSTWILFVMKFKAALDAPYSVFGTGDFSANVMLPATELMKMNFPDWVDACNSGKMAWNKRTIPTTFVR